MVQSSIVVPSTSHRKRSIDVSSKEESGQDEEIKRPRLETSEAGKNRNKRLFGALLGTLNKFKNETEKTSEVDKNRREINEKLHEKLELERKELQERLQARKEEKQRMLELKIQEEQELQAEERELKKLEQQEKLANFLRTETEPFLYYLPETLTDEMSLTIKEQKERVIESRNKLENKGSLL
ncbi:hypothetical protein INT47_010878 [Mucor saturninus]|uniref:Pinin/SDK/MemA protein domain-containing protein n=1 Tax=Mucor saturninus TaxID=64648 RepID=A0A8H7VB35_9FUNG|nr:hypothetical protein INT47_010878 [Mucor saturninus]